MQGALGGLVLTHGQGRPRRVGFGLGDAQGVARLAGFVGALAVGLESGFGPARHRAFAPQVVEQRGRQPPGRA